MMLINSGLKLNEEKLQMFENELKVKLPVDYKEFMLAHNGGMPEDDLMFNYHNSVNNKESRSLIQMFYIIYEEENYEIYNLKNICFTLWNDKALTKDYYNVPLVKTQMKKIIVTAKTLYSHPKNVSKIYAALHTDLAWQTCTGNL